MENESELVTNHIEKGTYFSEALSWYNSRFIAMQTQFSQMVIVCIIAVTAFLLCFFGFYSFLPVTEKNLHVVYYPVTPEHKLSIRKLMESHGSDPDYSLAKYYMEEYVKSRESYVLDKSERNFNYVYNMSEEAALDEYIDFVSPSNPQSPFVIYSNRGRKNVLVNYVKFYDSNENEVKYTQPEGIAKISFTAQENFGNSTGSPTNYIATISYKYTKIGIDQKTEQLTQPPKMVITNYTTKIDSGNKK